MPSLLAFALAPVFAVIALGFAAGRIGWVDNRHSAILGAFVAQFALPVSLFLAVVSVPRGQLAAEFLPAFAYGVALLGGFAAALAFARRRGLAPVPAALFILTTAMPNFGGIGLGLIQSLQGGSGAVSIAVANLIGTLTVMVWCFTQLERARGSGDTRRALRGALLKPMTVLPTIGFVLAFLGVPFPALAEAALRPLAQATGGAGLFLTGVILSTQVLRPTRVAFTGALISVALQPALAFLVALAIGLEGAVAVRAVVAMAVPTGFVGTILSSVYREGTAESGGTLVAASLLSALSLPFWIALATLVFGA
ncbi:AEC family transporter [Aureimonas sp. AU4]|uniref:AEC family transporter n=1 Tax=Aureimonas sp. AU4 TaxID=1638163 RepID=UPI000785BCA8|nr:AEC family transporter [Aureimonas sp. AU4]